MQSLSTVAETPNVVVAGLACAEADVKVRPSAIKQRTAAGKADLTRFEYFIGVTPGGANSYRNKMLLRINYSLQ
jgi:hypothetical protein